MLRRRSWLSRTFRLAPPRGCGRGDGAAVALSGLLREALSDMTPALPDDFPSSNDRLAMQYLRAMHAAGDAMTPLAVRREGQAFRDETLHDPSAPSASAIRLLMRDASADPDCLCAMLTGTMPDGALQVWLDAIRAGQAPTDGSALLPFLHAFFRLADPDELTGFSGLSGGLSHRLVRAALDAPTPAVFLSSLHSRLYTDARLRRAMLNAVLGVTDTDLRAVPVYTTLLAANRRGCAFLKDLRGRHSVREVPIFQSSPNRRMLPLAARPYLRTARTHCSHYASPDPYRPVTACGRPRLFRIRAFSRSRKLYNPKGILRKVSEIPFGKS